MTNFIYYAHFYKMTVATVTYSCRSTLEIVNMQDGNLVRRAAEDAGVLLEQTPDAVFIMLNPGGSSPLDETQELTNVAAAEIATHARSNLVLTRPDRTQRDIEALMERKHLCHVRVLNIFDIQQTISRELVNTIKNSLRLNTGEVIPNPPPIKPYSVFSPRRENELRARLDGQHMVVAAWSVNAALYPFFRLSYKKLSDFPLQIHGMSTNAFFHPLGREQWIDYIVENWPGDV